MKKTGNDIYKKKHVFENKWRKKVKERWKMTENLWRENDIWFEMGKKMSKEWEREGDEKRGRKR